MPRKVILEREFRKEWPKRVPRRRDLRSALLKRRAKGERYQVLSANANVPSAFTNSNATVLFQIDFSNRDFELSQKIRYISRMELLKCPYETHTKFSNRMGILAIPSKNHSTNVPGLFFCSYESLKILKSLCSPYVATVKTVNYRHIVLLVPDRYQ